MLDRIEQVTREDKFSRKFIREYVLKEAIDTDSKEFKKAIELFVTYANKSYFASKDKRIRWVKHNLEPVEVITEVFITVLMLGADRIVPIQGVAHQLGMCLGIEDTIEAVKTASEILAVCCDSGWYDMYYHDDRRNPTGTLGIIPNYVMEPHVLKFIKETKFMPPMICKPCDWETNSKGGLLTVNESVVLKNNHHTEELNLDALNQLQAIEYELDEYVVNSCVEVPKEPHKDKLAEEDFNGRVRERKVLEKEYKGKSFWLYWRYDSRGRAYSSGYHINIQSNSYKKACLNFKRKEYMSETI